MNKNETVAETLKRMKEEGRHFLTITNECHSIIVDLDALGVWPKIQTEEEFKKAFPSYGYQKGE